MAHQRLADIAAAVRKHEPSRLVVGAANGKMFPGRAINTVGAAGKKMRAAGDVEEQAVRRIESDERRIAVAPVGELFEERMVGRLVGLSDNEIGDSAARIRKGRTQTNSPPLGIFIDGDDTERALDFRDDGERSPRDIFRWRA